MKHLLKNHARKNQQAIVAVSHAVEKAVIAEAGEAISKKVSVIYNAVDTSRFSPPFEPRRNPQPLVAVVGRLVEQKGHLQLLRVLRSVQTPFRAHIVGSGELHSAIQKRINDLGLSEVIQMQPARADIQVVYKEADVVIIPSEWEGFGLVAIEAMSSGCTVVAANVDGLMEVVQNGVNGVVTDMHQISQAAAAIDSVLAYPDVRAQYGRAAREFASTHFTMREMGNSYMQWYNTILAQKIA
jgi:glycosyltransferase involved in cell wall biosynthesis